MTAQTGKLSRPPIVEVVVDIDCDLPPQTKVEALEKPARSRYQPQYPIVETRLTFEHQFEQRPDAPPKASTRSQIEGYLFKAKEGNQLVQARMQGFSFNRLAPYTTLTDYLPEIQRTWRLFVEFAAPVQVRTVRLRYINRLLLPSRDGQVELETFLKVGPRLPNEKSLTFISFLNQHLASETETGNIVQTILTSQNSKGGVLPLIFDITAWKEGPLQPKDWPAILERIESLRKLKNEVFFNTLTEECLQLYR